MTESSESRHGIQVLDRANRLLARLEASSEPLALTTLARETGLSASTVHRILGSLSAMGFVKQNPAGQWSLGLRLLELGNLVYERFTVRQRALPFMQQLHAATDMTVNLAIRDNDRLLYIEHVLAPEYKAASGLGHLCTSRQAASSFWHACHLTKFAATRKEQA